MTSPFLDPLLPAPAPADARYIWAKVTQSSPLRIQVDGDRTPLGITPDTLVSGLAVDQRVYCQIFNRRLVVLGSSGGTASTASAVAATPNTLMLRDAAGRSRVVDPAAAADIDTKGARDAAIAAAIAAAGVSAPTASTIMRRDSEGRGQVSDPVVDADIDTKGARDTAILAATRGQIPSSIAVGSGSASIDANGLITFTGASRVSLNDVFVGSPGEVYKVFVRSKGSANAYQYLRSRNAGVDVASAGYNRVATYTYSTSGPTRSGQFGDTVLTYLYPGGAAAPDISAEMTWHTPNVTGSVCQVHTVALSAASDRYLWEEYGQGNKADGLSLIAASGTMTGTMKIVRIA